MKKLLTVLLLVCLFVSAAFADSHKVGVISKVNMSAEEFNVFAEKAKRNGSFVFSPKEINIAHEFVFFDTLTSMQMALDAGNIDEIMLPEDVAEYIMNVSGKYEIICFIKTKAITFNLGFRADDTSGLRNEINEAIMSMKADGTLAILQDKYISNAGIDDPLPVEFEKYGKIDKKIKVAVTGDLPPIDFIAADGTPAGFNTAVLAEIGRRLKINIELVNIDSGARAASLASGRADVVFWFEFSEAFKDDKQPDIPDGVTLSEPYYKWNEFIHLKLKDK